MNIYFLALALYAFFLLGLGAVVKFLVQEGYISSGISQTTYDYGFFVFLFLLGVALFLFLMGLQTWIMGFLRDS